MSRRKLTTSADGINVNQCSLCDEFTLTVGQQRIGGVRYCRDCIRHTLAWVQMTPEQRSACQSAFAKMLLWPDVQALLAAAVHLTPEMKKANAIGESRRRLVESERID